MPATHSWDFFTNHAQVFFYLSRDPEQPLRTVALDIGITERAVQRIVADLEEAGYLSRERVGRRNRYRIHPERKLRHPLQSHCSIGQVMQVVHPRQSIRTMDYRFDVGGHGSEI
ncbi:helix-turn-helix transcriptional regulator [Coraliomargarita parva]|uniref:helix-turn-helix transcriptional regulator n=1 Tax=Coraliomargarita parva TaxID=3014050 RepID=UPI0022B56842|nr:winged helix-turn-helix domain-containing protein [Coraliomargarita parva]